MPSIMPASAAPRSEPMPPTMVAAIEISMTWWPIASFSPVVMTVTIAAGAASAEPIAKASTDSPFDDSP